MAMDKDETDTIDGSLHWHEYTEWIFQIIYTLEMILKILAQGFCCNKYSYLYDGWNILDFLVVILSWVTMFLDSANMSFIRTVRVLRTLRTLEAFPDLAELVRSLLELIPSMTNICILCVALVIVISCISMQLFGSGSLS